MTLQHTESTASTRQTSRLSDAFIEDHKILTRGLSSLLSALQHDDLPAAKTLADDLDRRAGPHIEFEELYFYPEVAKSRGRDYVAQLHREHDAGRKAIGTLLKQPPAARFDDDTRDAVVAQVQEALDHAVSCGTLLSHLEALSPSQQGNLLDELISLRRHGPRWTTRPPSSREE